MQTKVLYRYKTKQGGITVSPNKPNEKMYVGEITNLFRLIADEGMLLTNGEETARCIDTETLYQWSEIDDPKKEV